MIAGVITVGERAGPGEFARSMLAPTIAHGAFKATAGSPPPLLHDTDSAVAGVAYSPAGWLVMLAIIAILARSGRLTASTIRDAAMVPTAMR